MILHNGKPHPISSGCAWGMLLMPVLFIGGAWVLGGITKLLTWLVG